MEIQPGKCVAIVGRSGSGKTTLVRCLAGLQEPTGGTIRFDGVEQSKLSYRDLRRQIGFVLQENYLFDYSIAKEHCLWRGRAAFGPRHVGAAKVANAHEFIERLPLNYDTRVGETENRFVGRATPAHCDCPGRLQQTANSDFR